MPTKNIVLFTVFGALSVLIWVMTPSWFSNVITQINDGLIILLIAINAYTAYKSNRDFSWYFIIIHTLGIIEMLLVGTTHGCTESLSVRGDYFLDHYADRKFPFRGDALRQLLFPLEVILFATIIFLQVRILNLIK